MNNERDCKHGLLARSCEICGLEAEVAQRKAELAAMREQRPVAYWIPKAEQFCFASPTGRPFAKAWEPLYAAPGAKP